MTELSFLIDLLLNHKLPKATLAAVAARIKDVEGRVAAYGQANPPPAPAMFQARPIAVPAQIPAHMLGQSASTIAAMMRQEQAGGLVGTTITAVDVPRAETTNPTEVVTSLVVASPPQPQPVAVVAQTPAAVAAINDRQTAIAAQISGKPEKGRTSPRKF